MTTFPLLVPLVDLALSALSQGGQRTARRNAWAGMSADATRARARREADAALALAVRATDSRLRADRIQRAH